ncbi:MAG: lytic transglycosylase domain-containing protein [Firmicutes bacterium]|nr:lytic transglycosylase domain-containing protein [Bacillota bacterium]
MEERQAGNRSWALLLVLFMIIWHKPILKIFFVLEYQDEIIKYSDFHNLNPSMVSAMVFVESRFNAKAVSHKGAMGLMQIMPRTGEWAAKEMGAEKFKVADLLNPEQNLKVGTWYLAYLKKYYQDNDYLALASYNAGHRNVSRWIREGIWDGDYVKIEQIPFPETKKYLIKILLFRKVYHYLYPELNRPRIDKIASFNFGFFPQLGVGPAYDFEAYFDKKSWNGNFFIIS